MIIRNAGVSSVRIPFTNEVTMTNNEQKNIHEGHRNRLRERYERSGLDDFADHEILELLLTYAILRGDVNPQAHALIDRFGSLSAVLDADRQELETVDRVGPKASLFLKMLPEIFRRYQTDKIDDRAPFDTVAKLGEYLHSRYVGATVERVYLILLDNSLRMIDCLNLGDGAVNCSNITVRCIAEHALRNHAAAVVLAHNHPKGMAIPSGADLDVTQTVESALETIGVPLLEHMIITENSYATIMRQRRGLLRSSPVTGMIDQEFYRKFYGEA